ncbi:unnamed protein product, partial [Prorocentrum cordatum]
GGAHKEVEGGGRRRSRRRRRRREGGSIPPLRVAAPRAPGRPGRGAATAPRARSPAPRAGPRGRRRACARRRRGPPWRAAPRALGRAREAAQRGQQEVLGELGPVRPGLQPRRVPRGPRGVQEGVAPVRLLHRRPVAPRGGQVVRVGQQAPVGDVHEGLGWGGAGLGFGGLG